MTGNVVLSQPLPTRIRQAADMLLECRRFSCDALLIAADAFDEAGRTLRWDHAYVAAEQADALARRLRESAPARAHYIGR